MTAIQYETKAHVLNADYEVDWRSLAKKLRASKNKIIIAMHPAPEKLGGILLPEGQRQIRADVGTVVATPFPAKVRSRGYEVRTPQPGDIVLLHPADGTRLVFEEQSLASVGAALPPEEWIPMWCDWSGSILAELKDGQAYAYGENIIVELPEKADKFGSLLLPDVVQKWVADAEVVHPGDLQFDVQKGDRVSLDMDLCTYAGLQFVLGEGYERKFVIPPQAINFVYQCP